ncbi:DNA photolyase [Sergentomyia squamirostris]
MSSSGSRKNSRKRKASATTEDGNSSSDLVEQFQEDRKKTAASIIEFPFNKLRMRLLSEVRLTKEENSGIVYWMSRDGRVQDNWAMLFAQKLAIKNHVPLHVVFCLLPKFLDATLRHFKFLLSGLQEVAEECSKLHIEFHVLMGEDALPEFIRKYNIGGVVCDFSPLDLSKKWVAAVKEALPEDVPLCQVDAHNIVPVWVASNKVEYGARTIRKKITGHLEEFLTPFPPVIDHPFPAKQKAKAVKWKDLLDFLEVDDSVDEVDWAKPGYRAGVQVMQEFTENRLENYADKRNDALADAQSNLSPWLHFGHISAQRCILLMNGFRDLYRESVDSFCEELIIRRELSDNFCFYSENQNNFEGLHIWARTTLNAHRKDKREYTYTKKKFDDATTHDPLWNAAQIQLKREGKMAGYMRMYWAKKILEWTKSPEEAISIAIYLNDRYSLDGRDPNGFVGILWSIGGLHDGPWPERKVYGKVRYMALSGCQKKFKVKEYIAKYRGDQGDEKVKSPEPTRATRAKRSKKK